MNLASLFYKRLDGVNAQKTALVYLKIDGTLEKYSWNEYQYKAICIAQWLKRNNIKKGDFVAILPLNLPDSFFAILGIILIGAIPVPINIQLLKETDLIDLRKIIDDCKPKLILANESLDKYMLGINFHAIEGIIKASGGFLAGFGYRLTYHPDSYKTTETKDDDLLIMPYTSGTSGQPKGVMLTHNNIINRLVAITAVLAATEHEKILSYLPLGHIAELVATFFGQIYNGYTVYFTEYAQETLDNKEKFRKNFPYVLQRVKPTIFIAVPKIWTSFRKEIETKIKKLPIPNWILPQWLKEHVVKKGLGFSQTRVFISAAAKITEEDLGFFADLGIFIDDIYGQTETAGPLTLNGVVLGPNNKMMLENEEIIVVGDCVMAGYYQNSELNYKVFNGYDSGDRVFHTGDTGIEHDGKIFWTGRIDDDYKHSDGEKVNSTKREQAEGEIRKIDEKITEVMVWGANRPYSIALIFSENYTDPELREKIQQQLPGIGEGLMNPKKFLLLDAGKLELTPTFKLKRKVILEKLKSEIDLLYTPKKITD